MPKINYKILFLIAINLKPGTGGDAC